MAAEIIAPSGSAVAVSTRWAAEGAQAAHSMEVIANVAVAPTYRGAYEVTPSSEAQVLRTDALMMAGDVTVLPVPGNYGLITYNGSTITVS